MRDAPAKSEARLLVVDDEPTILELLAGTLRFAGFDVLTAVSGAEALRAAAAARPDLILLDVMMPHCDGFDVIRRIRAGRVLSRAQILDHVWDYSFDGDGNIVESYICYLRRKLDRGEPRLIHTIRGIGYVLRVPPP